MQGVTEDEARLVRAHREAGRLAVALIADPFGAETVARLSDWLPRAREASEVYGALRTEAPDLSRRIARLSQLAVNARTAGAA
ncbi:hypothetical protein [Streptomyces xiamenensis]|uniref:hypothetical protein n=1 Tax=Streptomyces xiamenensis TaxID=408015 RepID=UPI0035E39714